MEEIIGFGCMLLVVALLLYAADWPSRLPSGNKQPIVPFQPEEPNKKKAHPYR